MPHFVAAIRFWRLPMHVARIPDDANDDEAESQVKSLTPEELIARAPANRMHQRLLFEDDAASRESAADRILAVIRGQVPRRKPGRKVGNGKRTVTVYD